jgi:hypothetical protein
MKEHVTALIGYRAKLAATQLDRPTVRAKPALVAGERCAAWCVLTRRRLGDRGAPASDGHSPLRRMPCHRSHGTWGWPLPRYRHPEPGGPQSLRSSSGGALRHQRFSRPRLTFDGRRLMPRRQMRLQRVGPGSLCRGVLLGLAQFGLDRLHPLFKVFQLPSDLLELQVMALPSSRARSTSRCARSSTPRT